MRSRWRPALRTVAFVLTLLPLAVVGLVVIALLVARTDWGRERLRRLVLARARPSIPGLELGRVGGGLLRDITFDDVVLRDREGRRAVRIARIAIRFDLLPLMRRVIALRELRIEAPNVLARSTDDGASNLGELVARSPSAREGPRPAEAQPPAAAGAASNWRVEIAHLVIRGGAADVRTAGGEALAVEGLVADGALRLDRDRVEATLHRLEVGAIYGGRRYHVDLAARVALDRKRVDVRIPRLALSGVSPDGDLVLRATAIGPRGRIAVDLHAGTRDAEPLALVGRLGLTGAWSAPALGRYDLELGLLALDPGSLSDRLPRGRIDARLAVRGRGIPLRAGAESHLAADVSPSRIGDLRLRQVRLSGDSSDRRLRADLRLAVEQPARGGASTKVSGTGHAALHVAGIVPEHLIVRGTAGAEHLRLGALHVGALAVYLRAERDGALARLSGRFGLSARAVRAGGAVPPIDTLTIGAASNGRQLGVHGAIAGRRLNAALDARGRVNDREVVLDLRRLFVRYRGAAGGDEASDDDETIALRKPVRISWQPADQRVDLGAARLRGAGRRFAGDLVVQGHYRAPRLDDRSEALARLIVGLRKASFGGLDPIDADADATIGRRSAIARLDASIGGARVHVDADVPLSSRRQGLARHGPIAVHVTTERIALRALPRLQRRLARRGISSGDIRADATVEGDVAHPEAHAAIEVSVLSGVTASLRGDARAGQTHVAGRVSLRGGAAAIIDARSPIDLGAIIAGRDPRDAPWRATIEIPKLPLAPFAALAALDDDANRTGGVMTGKATVSGTPRRPTGTADVSIAGLRIDDVAFDTVRLNAVADTARVRVAADVVQTHGGRLHVEADGDRSAGGAFNAHLRAQHLDLGFVQVLARRFGRPFAPNLREIGGTLDAAVDVTADMSQDAAATPRVNGSLSIADGTLGLSGQPTFHDVALTAEARSGEVDIGRLVLRSGDGVLEGKGRVVLEHLRPSSVVLTAHADRFLIDVAKGRAGRLDGDVAIEAALRAPVLSGEVRIPLATLWLPRSGGSPAGSSSHSQDLQSLEEHANLRFVDAAARAAREEAASAERKAGRSPPTRLDVRGVAETVYVRGRDFDLELESDLRFASPTEGAPRRDPTLSGTVSIRRGRLEISGRRFDVERGRVVFDGSPDPNPALDIRIAHAFPEATVAVEIGGTLRSPELRLTSDPAAYDQAQIVNLILTGRAGSHGSAGEGLDAAAALTPLLFGQIVNRIAPQLGLDVVRLENIQGRTTEGLVTGQTDTRLEVGRYLGDSLYLSYAHVFGASESQNSNEARVEYSVTARWMIETVFGDSGLGGIDVFWMHRY